MKSFIKYTIKKDYKVILVVFLVSLTYLAVIRNESLVSFYRFDISYISFLAMALSIFFGNSKTSYLHTMKKLDVYLTLPLSRREFTFANLLSGFITYIVPLSISYLIGYFVLMSARQISFWFYFLFLIILIISSLCYYVICYFISSRANSTFDGFVFSIFWLFLFSISYLGFVSFLETIINSFNLDLIIDYKANEVIDETISIFRVLIDLCNKFNIILQNNSFNLSIVDFCPLIFLIVISALFIFLLYKMTKSDKAERTEEISSSLFGYRLIIPVYYFSIIMMGGLFLSLLSYVIILIAAMIGYIMYFKKVRFNKESIIVLLCGLVLSILLNIL